MSDFKPMLSGKVIDTANLPYPMLASPKLDGIRSLNLQGNSLVSRNLKAIPNRHAQRLFAVIDTLRFDGELICGSPTAKDCYNATNSAVMSIEGTAPLKFYVFDHFEYPDQPFTDRYHLLMKEVAGLPNIEIVEQVLVKDEAELLAYEEKVLGQGYEGVMLRRMDGKYKFGRATDAIGRGGKGAELLKLKRFTDDEAQIIGFEELLSNQNEATKDELGHTERSSHKENMVPMNTLGALIVKDMKTGVEFNIGTGFDADTRQRLWDGQQELLGQIVKYKHFAVGAKDKPRFPVFLGFRDAIDM